jgi:hypothetical protein
MVVEAPEPEAEPLDVLDDQVHALGGRVGELGAVRGQDRGPPSGRLRDDISPDRASRAGTGPQGRHLCARHLCPRTATLFREGRLPAQMPANTAVAADLAKVRVAGSSPVVRSTDSLVSRSFPTADARSAWAQSAGHGHKTRRY